MPAVGDDWVGPLTLVRVSTQSRSTEESPRGMGRNSGRPIPRRDEIANHVPFGSILHNFDSLPAVDSEKADGGSKTSLSRQFKDRVV